MFKHCTFIFLIASLLAAFIVSSAIARERGIVPVPIKDKSGSQVGLYKGSYALVIGVSNYVEHWPTLRGVRDDVRVVSDTLNSHGFKVLLVKNPNYAELISAINAFIRDYGFDPQNRLLFYFAGHGYTHKPSYATNDPEEWMGYFLTSNSPDPKYNHAEFVDNSLSMQRIEELALKIESKHVLFVFDSCFSGSIFSTVRATPDDIKERTAKHVRQFITAGGADETVPDVSIFRRQFVSAIDGEADRNRDGYVTGSELGMFLEETVINLSRRTQTPQYGKLRHRRLNKGDFVFSLYRKTTPEKGIVEREMEKMMQKLQERASKVLEEERLRREREKADLQEDQLRIKRERKILEEERLSKERELVEREQKLEEKKREIQELQEKTRKVLEEERLRKEGEGEVLEEERLRKERELVEREQKLEEQKREMQELQEKTRKAFEEERLRRKREKAVLEEDQLRIKRERKILEEERLSKDKELVEREQKLEEKKREIQELEKKERENLEEERLRRERELVEREQKLEEQKKQKKIIVKNESDAETNKFKLGRDLDNPDDPLTEKDERYYCREVGHCYFDHDDAPTVYEDTD